MLDIVTVRTQKCAENDAIKQQLVIHACITFTWQRIRLFVIALLHSGKKIQGHAAELMTDLWK